MKNIRILQVLFYGALLFSMAACGHQQGHGMMHGNGTMGTTNWNWLQIVSVLGIGLLLGVLVARRKR